MNKIKQSFSYIIIFLVSYLIYVYPFDVINYLLIDEGLYKVTSIFFTLFIYLIVIFYFKTKITKDDIVIFYTRDIVYFN